MINSAIVGSSLMLPMMMAVMADVRTDAAAAPPYHFAMGTLRTVGKVELPVPTSEWHREISSVNKIIYRSVLTLALVSILAGCDEKASLDQAQQSGSDPSLPKAQNSLKLPMQVPDGVGWKQGQAPKVAAGLKIEEIASGLKHPRQLYVLPNDDILVCGNRAK